MSFNGFGHSYGLKSEATSKIKYQNISSTSSLIDVRVYLRDGPFEFDIGFVKLHPSKATHWVAYNNQNNFDPYVCSPPQKLSKFIKKRNGHCSYSELKIQKLTIERKCYCGPYCRYRNYETKALGIDFISVVLSLYYQRLSSHKLRYEK